MWVMLFVSWDCFLSSLLFSCRSEKSITTRFILRNILVQDHVVKITLGNICVGYSRSRLTGNHAHVVLWLQYRFCGMLLISSTKRIYFERGWLCSRPLDFARPLIPQFSFIDWYFFGITSLFYDCIDSQLFFARFLRCYWSDTQPS